MAIIVFLVQQATHVPLRALFKLACGLEILGAKNLKGLKRPFLLVSNHKTILDPWIIGSSFPMLARYFPIYYMAGNTFKSRKLTFLYKIGVIPLLYFLFGAFTLPDRKENMALCDKLEPFICKLKKGRVVHMFPEGRLNREDNIREFKIGAAEIIRRTGCTVLPVVTRNVSDNKGNAKKIVYFDEPFESNGESAEILNKKLHERIEKAYKKLRMPDNRFLNKY